jgi:hypothetical protein|tara:strand:- start:94 stop:195 length:102 start_codon:yes stop_codon:yes gene_type:complete
MFVCDLSVACRFQGKGERRAVVDDLKTRRLSFV